MSAPGNECRHRIQQEIEETRRREDESRLKPQNNNLPVTNNGFVNFQRSASSAEPQKQPIVMNGNKAPLVNGSRLFAPNPASRGVMQKFLKMRGKINSISTFNTSRPQNGWSQEDSLQTAKVTLEPGKHIRNGFVPAKEKISRELQDFERREAELRKERRKSQPDLMAALETERAGLGLQVNNLKPAPSVNSLYSQESTEDSFILSASQPSSLKKAKSLAELCDLTDDELETVPTRSLIMQFEMMNRADS